MKVFAVVIAALAAAVFAQDSSPTTAAATATPSLSAYEKCVSECAGDDLSCRASCGNVPNPDENTVNETTKCAAACDQGDGSPEDTARYAACQQACISSIFLSGTVAPSGGAASTAPAAPTGSGAVPTGTNGAATTLATETSGGAGGESPTGTEAASSPTSTGAGSNVYPAGAGAAGLGGLLLAILAL